ncbi:MAG TPA: hydroxyethylthiazole kinase, partial [Candidatus Saccharimonadales bacterium]|nr:hydroxyethylthiazole kinase [Candidatus Saccharimonadales bacterium]
PLLNHITNFVVMNDTANLTLHLGALPVMAHAKEEMEEMVAMAGSLILNPGTLNTEWVESMNIAGKKANSLNIPIVLDPVGAGATTYRTKTNMDFLQNLHIAVLRGNSGEIGALSGAGGKVKGVESVEGVRNPELVAQKMAKEYNNVVVITGKRDIIASDKDLYYVDNGHELLSTITGTGCMSTTMIGAFSAVEKDYALASAAALATFGLAAEIAAKKSNGPASFKVALLDSVYNLLPEQVEEGAKIIQVRSDSER